jgi:hypothetical protein
MDKIMKEFEILNELLSKEREKNSLLTEINETLKAIAAQMSERKTADYLTDEYCIQRMVDTGFIMINPRVNGRTVYVVKKGYSVLEVFDELAKVTGSKRRARAIMIQNMTGVESTLNTHRKKHTLET